MGCIISKLKKTNVNKNKEYEIMVERETMDSISTSKSIFGAFLFQKPENIIISKNNYIKI